MKLSRRTFFKVNALGAAALAAGAPAASAATAAAGADTVGVLVDTTRCVGCRACEAACAEANALPEPDPSGDVSRAAPRQTSEKQWTAVRRYDTRRGEVFVKTQCMHCVQPACAAGCLTKALEKQDNGAVTWNGDRCMGCRFCMIACPFDVPKFEYQSWNPRIQKCQLCVDRLAEGKSPACVEVCPAEALTFGKRSALLEIARQRIYQSPGAYVPHVYGEHEVGGTGWLYISRVPFEELGFRTDLGTTPVPETTRDFLTGVPLVLVAWPAMLLALRRASAEKERAELPVAVGARRGFPVGEEI